MLKKTAENPYTDKELVEKILAGDRYAFARLVKSTENLVGHLIFKMISIVEDRKDVAQDVYMKVHSNLHKFRFQSKLSTWIGQITYNACLHHLQKKRPVLLANFFDSEKGDEQLENIGIADQNWENETETKLLEKELALIIDKAVLKLPAIYQTLIALYHQEKLTLAEVSAITGLPEGTVKSYLFRARKQLKQILLKMEKREEL